MDDVWEVMGDHLYFLHHGYNVLIHAFVLMANHFHLLASTPDANISIAMGYFMQETSRSIKKPLRRINQTWGGPYYRCLLKSESHFMNAYKYIYRNPVAAGITARCEEYKYSTLHGLLGFERTIIPVVEDTLLFTPELNLQHIEWLNTGKAEDAEEVRRALAKREFKFRKQNQKFVRPDDFLF